MADGLLSLIDDELLRRGLISSAALNDPQGASAEPGASMFPPLPDGPLDAKLMMAGLQLAILSQMIRGAIADAQNAADVLDALDQLVEAGVPSHFDAIIQLALSFPPGTVDKVHDELATHADGVDGATAAVIGEAVALQQMMLKSVFDHLKSRPAPQPSASSPLDHPRNAANLVLLPVPIAKLHLRAQRGILASSIVVDAVAPPRTEHPAWLVLVAAEAWRDGNRAQAVMLASLFPDWPIAQVVPREEMLDFEAIVREQLRIDARTNELLDELPEGGSAPFHAPSR